MTEEEHTNLAEKIESFKEEYFRKQYGNDYKIFGPWINEISLISGFRTLPEGTRPLAHSLYAITRNLNLGQGFEKVIDSVTKAVLTMSIPNATPGGRLLLKNALTVLALTIIVGTTYFATEIEGSGQEEADIKESRFFTLELLLHMIVATDMLQDTFTILTEVCGATPEKQQAANDILSLLTLILVLNVASSTGKYDLYRLLQSMQSKLVSLLESVEKYLEKTEAHDLIIAVKQGKIQLADDDPQGFLTAIIGALNAIQVPPELWQKDLHNAEQYSLKLISLLKNQNETDVNELTGFFQAG